MEKEMQQIARALQTSVDLIRPLAGSEGMLSAIFEVFQKDKLEPDIICKVLPPDSGDWKFQHMLCHRLNLFARESAFYSLRAQINSSLVTEPAGGQTAQLSSSSSEVSASKNVLLVLPLPAPLSIPDKNMIAIQHLKSFGYTSCSLKLALTEVQLRACIQALADFHSAFSSVSDSQLQQLCPLPNDEMKWFASTTFDMGVDDLRRRQHHFLSPELVEKIAAIRNELLDSVANTPQDRAQMALCHSDLWAPNILLKPQDDSAVALIDFQWVALNYPIVDVFSLVFTAASASVRQTHLPSLVQDYCERRVKNGDKVSLDQLTGKSATRAAVLETILLMIAGDVSVWADAESEEQRERGRLALADLVKLLDVTVAV